MKAVYVAVLTTSLAVGAFAAAVRADNVSMSGKWQLHQSIVGNESDQACTFTQEGANISGSCTSDQTTGKLTGKVAENKVSWTYKSEYNGSPITLNYAGTVDANSKITGTVRVEEYSVDGEFTATKSK